MAKDETDVKDGVLYGCHIELLDGEEPDGCVIDYGVHMDCIYGLTPSGRPRKSKWTCRYWKPVIGAGKGEARE